MQNDPVSTYESFTQMIGSIKFCHVYCCHVFFYKIPKYVLDQNNILSSSMCWPTWLVIIWMMNAGRLGSMWPEIVSQKFIIFLACPINPLSASVALI